MPFDVIRKRMQIQGALHDQYALSNLMRYGSLKECVGMIWLNEGIRGYYKGLTIALCKSMPAAATTFVVYGFLNRL